MRTFTGTVRNGAIKLPADARVPDGSRVVLAVLGEAATDVTGQDTIDLEDEDVEFVRACRGRIARHMRAEDTGCRTRRARASCGLSTSRCIFIKQ